MMATQEARVQSRKTENTDLISQGRSFLPSTDILEFDNKLVLNMDMPGTSKEAVHIELEQDKLTVETMFNSKQYEGLNPLYSEYPVGPYSRTFSLSAKIDKSQIEAKMELGVLSITLPKKVELSRKITVS